MALINIVHFYTKTYPECSIEFNVCWTGCRKFEGNNIDSINNHLYTELMLVMQFIKLMLNMEIVLIN